MILRFTQYALFILMILLLIPLAFMVAFVESKQ